MPYFLSSISRVSDGQGLRQWWTNAYFFMKAVTGNPKLHLDWKTLENTGNWYLYVHQFIKLVVFGWFCSNIFSNSSFFGVVDMNSITDAAIINRFLKLLFCNRSWFLDITQSKYIITRQQCLKSPEMLILCEAGQNDLQKCPSLTKFLPKCNMCNDGLLWNNVHEGGDAFTFYAYSWDFHRLPGQLQWGGLACKSKYILVK